jgi:hypothetical protein
MNAPLQSAKTTYPNDHDFDSIVVVNSPILRRLGIMPSQWRIEGIERARITQGRVGLIPVTWPGMNWTPSIHEYRQHFVIFDTLHLINGSISKDELVAFLMHEIGHVVNRPPSTTLALMGGNPDESEFYADDYARHCGLGAELGACLKTLCVIDPQGFGDPVIQRRICRIESNEKLLLNLSSVS